MGGSTASRRLNLSALSHLPRAVARPAFDPAATRVGIVHIGPGAFHRAHQAAYIDDLLGEHPDWAISGISLQSTGVRDALRPQDGLYTLALLGAQEQLRVIGSLRELLCARDELPTALARLADPAVRLVTITVTEKGYCLAGEDLDTAHPDIAHDLASPTAPRSMIGYLVAGLRLRRAQGVAPCTVLSCDNLAANGQRLRRAVLQFAGEVDAGLAGWIEDQVAFPCSMVDSITPATDEALRSRVDAALGCADAWPVQRESWTQWVIEDHFCNERPPLELAGVTFSRDIAGYDRAKLRLLNGAHSTLAYLGALLGLETVGDAMQVPELARFVERLMRESIAPATTLPAGLDASTYIDAILTRFRNPAIRHRLLQIAWDGSQKLPVRLLGTIDDALQQGRDIGPLCLAISAWMHFVRRQARAGIALVDPLDETLRATGRACSGDAHGDVAAFLALKTVFADRAGDARFVAALQQGYAALEDGSASKVLGGIET